MSEKEITEDNLPAEETQSEVSEEAPNEPEVITIGKTEKSAENSESEDEILNSFSALRKDSDKVSVSRGISEDIRTVSPEYPSSRRVSFQQNLNAKIENLNENRTDFKSPDMVEKAEEFANAILECSINVLRENSDEEMTRTNISGPGSRVNSALPRMEESDLEFPTEILKENFLLKNESAEPSDISKEAGKNIKMSEVKTDSSAEKYSLVNNSSRKNKTLKAAKISDDPETESGVKSNEKLAEKDMQKSDFREINQDNKLEIDFVDESIDENFEIVKPSETAANLVSEKVIKRPKTVEKHRRNSESNTEITIGNLVWYLCKYITNL